jgi:3-hydroxyisobutyrate dehydrogenase
MKVGFIGLGMMGGGMSLNIRRGGFDMVVHDLRQDASARQIEMGCAWADSPRAVGEQSEVVFTSLPGPREVEAVALSENGLLAGMAPGSVWFDLSTNSPTVVRRLHAQLAERGITMMDSPVSGGPRGANSGQLAIWVGGDKAMFDKHKNVLDAFSDQAVYIGPIGAGSVAKLVHNMAGYAIQAAMAEVFTMGVKAGVEPLAIWAAVRQGALGRRRTFDRLADDFLQGKFDPPSFALRLAHKDVSLATEVGREMGVPMRVCNLVREEMTEALNRGWAERDSRVSMLLQEERAGVEIKVPLEEIQAIFERDGR